MPKRTMTFEIEYTYFEPGTLVTPIGRNTTLEFGRVYSVVECYEPTTYLGLCTCRVRENWGHQHEHPAAVFTGNLREAEYREVLQNG